MKRIIYLLTVLPLFLLWSCNNDDFEQETPKPAPQAGDKIAFTIGFAPQMQTRVATGADFNSTWETGDEIGVYIVKGDVGLQATGNHVDNMQMTYTLPTGTEYYPNDDNKLHCYAYYPYQATVDPTNFTFAVQADQNGNTYNQSDLLSAKATNIAKGDAVNLQFSHALSSAGRDC